MSEAIVVLISAANSNEGETLAETLVCEGLAACVSLVPGVRAIYRWQGAVERAEETLLVVKTARTKLNDLQTRVTALHSYDVPEIIALSIEDGLPAYLAWLLDFGDEGR